MDLTSDSRTILIDSPHSDFDEAGSGRASEADSATEVDHASNKKY
jgi:hypothetical protein